MKKEKKYTVNTVQYIAGAATACFFIAAAVYNAATGRYLASGIFLILGTVFLAVSVANGMKLRITEQGIEQSVFGKTVRTYKKDEIKEIGVVGLRVFGKSQNKGTKYIYISKEKMNDTDRFQMCLKWPPRDKMYMTWNAKRLHDVQMFWNREIETYNTEDLML